MEKYTCLVCGKEFQSDKEKETCSTRCGKTYWQRKKRCEEKGLIYGVCISNEGVECYQHNCTTCGWNPIVARQRLAMIMGRLKG